MSFAKLELVPIGIVDNVAGLAGILGFWGGILEVSWSFVGCILWDGVIEKIERRLTSWKRLYLSESGRITLIKSTLFNLPTYLMSLFPRPMCVANHIEKLQWDFL